MTLEWERDIDGQTDRWADERLSGLTVRMGSWADEQINR